MSNKKRLFLLALTAALALSGCGGKKEPAPEADEPTPSDSSQLEVITDDKEEAETEQGTEDMSEISEALSPITPSDYLVKNVSDYITLGSLDGLTATQTAYEITDEMVQERVEEELYLYSEEKEVEKAADGDTVYVTITSSVQGGEVSEPEDTYFVIGDEDYGAEFDAQLIGAAAGDELKFSISYVDDAWFDEWNGKTVNFEVSVTGVYETVVPEYTDDFVTTNTGFASKDEFEEALRETIEDEYTQDSYSETINALFQDVIDRSTFNGYPEELYASCEDEIISYYAMFLGTDDRDAILDSLGITKEDLESDVLNTVNLRLVICALCEQEGIEVTEDEYVSEITADAEEYGYVSAVEYEEDNTRETLVWNLYQNKAAEYLYDHAEITPVEATEEDLYGDFIELETEEETSGADEVYAAEFTVEE